MSKSIDIFIALETKKKYEPIYNEIKKKTQNLLKHQEQQKQHQEHHTKLPRQCKLVFYRKKDN